MIEPTNYVPIVPMVLVNGANGIGTGWSTRIPNHDIHDCIQNVRLMLNGEEPREIFPMYNNFRGTITTMGKAGQVACFGEVRMITRREYEITELPPGVWTQTYKERLMNMVKTKKIEEFESYSSHDRIKIVVRLTKPQARVGNV